MNIKKIIGISSLVIGTVLVLLNYLFLVPFALQSGSILYFASTAFLIIYGILGICFSKSEKKLSLLAPVAFIGVLVILMIISGVLTSEVFNASTYANVLSMSDVPGESSELVTFDEKSAGIIPPQEAEAKMISNMSQNGNIGSVMKLGTVTRQVVQDRVVYVAPLEYTGFFNWMKNKGSYDGYMIVDATTGECKMVNTEINYISSAYFGLDLSRHLYSVDKTKIYGDYTFEIDDNGKPYFTITTYKNKLGLSLKCPTGLALVDCATGDVEFYRMGDTPDFIDRVMPIDFVDDAINYKGALSQGFRMFDKKGKYVTTDGIGFIYMNDRSYYYTGITSLGSDDASIGFYLIDSKTGVATLYNKAGVTENKAQDASTTINKSQQYTPSFPILTNLENDFVYFIPLLDSTNRVSEYAFVNASDISIKGSGKTIADARNEYTKSLMSSNSLTSVSGIETELSGTIERIGMYNEDGNSYFIFKLDSSDKLFVGTQKISPSIPILKNGDSIKIKFLNVDLETINISSLENNLVKTEQ